MTDWPTYFRIVIVSSRFQPVRALKSEHALKPDTSLQVSGGVIPHISSVSFVVLVSTMRGVCTVYRVVKALQR